MNGNQRMLRNLLLYIGLPIVVLFIIIVLFQNRGTQQDAEQLKYSDITNYFETGQVAEYKLNLGTRELNLTLNDDQATKVTFELPDINLFYQNVLPSIEQYNEEHPDQKMVQDVIRPVETSWFISLLPTLILFAVLILFWVFMMRRLSNMVGPGSGREMGFGKAKVKQIADEKRKTTFADVAGADEEKEELREIVEFLKNPARFNNLGARIPKGVLLVGPPGTGKTLLARAVAGEAGVPFFSISGSDFVEMYVGVGASRVRDLFEKAKRQQPCIIFIDEIDAVGRQRGAGLGGGHDEREQTLNQLLVEMDGFGANEGVIMIAATNRPDILDPALMRPGRFDRQVVVSAPDIKGREDILRVHAKGKPLAPDVVLSVIAKSTAGFTGADLENLLNEAALLAARRGLKAITMAEIEEATIKVVVGTEKKSHAMSEKEKKLTAYHEAGHAITTYYCGTQDPVHQISIIPRGLAGGYTMHLPTEDRSYQSRDEMKEQLVVLLGGRVAEALVLDDISTGASNDIERATKIARAMVMKYGMSEKLGPITYGTEGNNPFLGKEMGHVSNYSEKVASEIDGEIQQIIEVAYKKAEQILSDHIDELHRLAAVLYEREKVDGEEFVHVMEGTLLPASAKIGELPAESTEQTGPEQASLEQTSPEPQIAEQLSIEQPDEVPAQEEETPSDPREPDESES